MIGLENRLALAADIALAHQGGARLVMACQIVGVDLRTLQRWRSGNGLSVGDRRPQAIHPAPPHALTEQERVKILEVANEARFADIPPARIVPMLAGRRAKCPSWPCKSASKETSANHPYRYCAWPSMVLGYDLLASQGDWAMVLPVPDLGFI